MAVPRENWAYRRRRRRRKKKVGRFCHCWFSEHSRPQSETAGAGDESRMKATCVGSSVHQALSGLAYARDGPGRNTAASHREAWCHRLSFSEPHCRNVAHGMNSQNENFSYAAHPHCWKHTRRKQRRWQSWFKAQPRFMGNKKRQECEWFWSLWSIVKIYK